MQIGSIKSHIEESDRKHDEKIHEIKMHIDVTDKHQGSRIDRMDEKISTLEGKMEEILPHPMHAKIIRLVGEQVEMPRTHRDVKICEALEQAY